MAEEEDEEEEEEESDSEGYDEEEGESELEDEGRPHPLAGFLKVLAPYTTVSHVIPHNFGPGRGWGMRATKKIAEGERVLSISSTLVVTPQKVKELLGRWFIREATAGTRVPGPDELLKNLVPGMAVHVSDNKEKLLAECRRAGISETHDRDRVAVLGRRMGVIEVDWSDDTVAVKGEGFDEIWFPHASVNPVPVGPEVLEVLSDEDLLAAFVMGVRSKRAWTVGVEEALKAHVEMMPQEIESPLFWTDADAAELQGCTFYAQAQKQRFYAKDSHHTLYSIGGEGVAGTFNEYCWALACVRSRSYRIGKIEFPSLSRTTGVIMCPLMDIFNHDSNIGVPTLMECGNSGTSIDFFAATNYEKDDEVLTSYGRKDNGGLLLNWGFVPETNPNDFYEVQITCDSAVPGSMKAKLCEAVVSSVGTQTFRSCQRVTDSNVPFAARTLLKKEDPVPDQLLALCRLEKLKQPEWEYFGQALGEKALYDCMQNARRIGDSKEVASGPRRAGTFLDVRVVTALEHVVRQLLDSFPTTIEEDDAALVKLESQEGWRASRALYRKAMILKCRRGQKEILECAQKELANRVTELSCWPLKEASRVDPSRGADNVLPLGGHAGYYADFMKLELGSEEETAFTWIQSCSFMFLWYYKLTEHPASWRSVLLPNRWPMSVGALPVAETPKGPVFHCDEENNELLAMYCLKMRSWGALLVSQFYATGKLVDKDMMSMLQDCLSLRKRHAFSVPTEEALATIGRYCPVIELGAGCGYWARLLKERGHEVLPFTFSTYQRSFHNTRTNPVKEGAQLDCNQHDDDFVQEGGPEAVRNRRMNLVLMWPDYGGEGSFGLQCIEAWLSEFAGERNSTPRYLICVGEWGNAAGTYGPITTGVPLHGQSFSQAFQDRVFTHFVLQETISLPTWPLFADCLRVFRRRNRGE